MIFDLGLSTPGILNILRRECMYYSWLWKAIDRLWLAQSRSVALKIRILYIPVITSTPESTMTVLKWIRLPFCHIWISSVCPGIDGLVKRAFTALNNVASLSANVWRTARTEKPNVHSPCMIGTAWPPILANSGSICNGFKSPDSLKGRKYVNKRKHITNSGSYLYKAAWSTLVVYLIEASNGRFGAGITGMTSLEACCLPPKLPAPTMNVDNWFRTSSFPLWSCDSPKLMK